MQTSIKISADQAGERIDVFLQNTISFTRNQIQDAIKQQAILLNGLPVKPSHKLKNQDEILIDSKYFENLEKPIELIPEKIPFKILFENNDVIVVDKPSNMVVHPAHGNKTGTLVNALLEYSPEIINSRDDDSQYAYARPGIVHRLDKDTSGVIIVAKNKVALSWLATQLEKKQFHKTYTALVFANAPESGKIESNLARDKNNRKIMAVSKEDDGKLAITNFKKLSVFKKTDQDISLVELEIPTGRTHQIRVQMKSINHPIIGDQTYFTKDSKRLSDLLGAKRQMLHASKISFQLPHDNKFTQISSDLPSDFKEILDKLS